MKEALSASWCACGFKKNNIRRMMEKFFICLQSQKTNKQTNKQTNNDILLPDDGVLAAGAVRPGEKF